MRKRPDLLLLLPFAVLLGWLQWKYDGYIKDDTFIALRYSRNLAEGHGMVFNYGQRLEGYTDFLWIVATVPAFWLGIDPVVWVKGMACACGQGGLLLVYAITRHFGGDRSDVYCLFGVGIWSVSGSVVLWSMAGMEPTAMAILCSGGVLYLMKLWARPDDEGDAPRHATIAGLLLAGGALCRPEGHAFVLAAAGVGIADAVRRKAIPRPWVRVATIFVVLLAPYHLWRYLYFGGLVPNTYLAKAGKLDVDRGMDFVGELLGFQANPGVFALAALAILLTLGALLVSRWSSSVPRPERVFAPLLAFGLGLFFMAYLVKVGRDEMKWFRLYLPVYPLVVALAAHGVRQIGQPIETLVGRASPKPWVAMLAGVLLVGGGLYPAMKVSVELDLKKAKRHDKYLKWSEDTFQVMARYARERSMPGEVVVFQDMGAAPYAAGDLRWVDTIGILDKRVATELSNEGVNPFLRGEKREEPGGRRALDAMDKRLRTYFLEQDPSWVAFVAYVSPRKRRSFWKKWKRVRGDPADEEALLEPYVKSSGHSHYLAADKRFQRDFHYVAAWDRLDHGYWIVLYRSNADRERGDGR